MTPGVAANIAAVRARIAHAAEQAGRDAGEITLVGISKTHPAASVRAAFDAGLRDFGENRVQEASAKIDELRAANVLPRWHLVGHLQRNKVAAAVDRFDILHSIDSIRVAEAINERAAIPVRVLIEVNIGGEASKLGVAPIEASALAANIAKMRQLDLVGLMTVAPRVDDPEDVRPVFRRLRELRDAIGLRELSMGMTDDFDVAVSEGSTLVRVGRAIFGDRAIEAR